MKKLIALIPGKIALKMPVEEICRYFQQEINKQQEVSPQKDQVISQNKE